MMMKPTRPSQRGLTLIELLLSLTITLVIGMAMTGVIGAVVSGVDVRRDSRSHVVRGYASQSRLSAYLVPSRAFLLADDDLIVLWFDDSRKSDSVHATEIRWLQFDSATQTIAAHFVKFPENWTTMDRWLEDREYARDDDWRFVLLIHRAMGYIESATLVDGVSQLRVSTDEDRPVDSRHIMLQMTLAGEGGDMTTQVSGTLRSHSPPLK